jgi:hypothetical protein
MIISLLTMIYIDSAASSSAHVTESESASYWTSSAKPFQIFEASSVFGSPCGISNSGGYELAVRNADPSPLKISAVVAGGINSTFCERGSTTIGSLTLDSQTTTVLVLVTTAGNVSCPNGTATSIPVIFNYTRNEISHTQTGMKELFISCTNSPPSTVQKLV